MPVVVATSRLAAFNNTDAPGGGSYDFAHTAFAYTRGRTYMLFLYCQYSTGGIGASGDGEPIYMGDVAAFNAGTTYGGPPGGWYFTAAASVTAGWFPVANVVNGSANRKLWVYVYQPSANRTAESGFSIYFDNETALLGVTCNIVDLTNVEFLTPIRTHTIQYMGTAALSNTQTLATVGKQANAMLGFGAINLEQAMSVETANSWSAIGANTTGSGQAVSTQVAFRNSVSDISHTYSWTPTSTAGAFFLCELMGSRYPMVTMS